MSTVRELYPKVANNTYSSIGHARADEYNEIIQTELGGFNFMIYYDKALLTYEYGINRADLTKVLFLASFMDYSNTLVLNYGRGTENIPMTKKDIIYHLDLNERVGRNFLNDMKKKGIIIEENKRFKLNDNLIKRGKLDNKFNKHYAKIYNNTIQDLYRGINKRMLDKLGFLLEIVAFIQKDTNRIVNPLHSEKPINMDTYYVSTIDLYTLYMDREMDGASRQQINSFKQSLLKIKFNAFGREFSAFMFVKKQVGENTMEYWVLNPHLINKLSDVDKHIEIIKSDFDTLDK